MRNALVYVLLSFCAGFFNLFASSETNLWVRDYVTHQPLAGVQIRWQYMQSREAQFVYTDVNGLARLPIKASVVIRIHQLGYTDISDTVQAADSIVYDLQLQNQELSEVVVTAQFAPSDSRNSVYQVQVLDAEEIRNRAASNLRDLLITQNAVQINEDPVLGSSIGMQGLSGQNVQIMIDGVALAGRMNGNIDLSQISLANAERVEIINGPMSVLYGSNALAGVVNIITKNGSKNKINASLNALYETVGQYNLDGHFALHFNRANAGHDLSLSGGRNFFDGFDVEDSGRSMQWKPKEQYHAAVSYKWLTPKFTCNASSAFFRERLLNRGDTRPPLYLSAFDQEYYTYRSVNNLKFNYFVASDKTLEFQSSYSWYLRNKWAYFKDLTNLESIGLSSENQDTSSFDIWQNKITYSYFAQRRFTYQFGLQSQIESGRGPRISKDAGQIGDFAAFGSASIRIGEAFQINPSVRLIYNTRYQAPLIPSIYLLYQAGNSWSFRASAARGFRSPAIKELYMEFVDINHNISGNTELKAETSLNLQLSAEYRKKIKSNYLILNSNAYHNRIQNLISLVSYDNDHFTYANIYKSRSLGFKLELKFVHPNIEALTGLDVGGSMHSMDSNSMSGKFSWSEDVHASLNWIIPKWNMQCNLFVKYNGPKPGMYMNEIHEVNRSMIADYCLIDASVSKKFWKNRIEYRVGVKNLLNVTNVKSIAPLGSSSSEADSYSVNWGRSFFSALHLNLHEI